MRDQGKMAKGELTVAMTREHYSQYTDTEETHNYLYFVTNYFMYASIYDVGGDHLHRHMQMLWCFEFFSSSVREWYGDFRDFLTLVLCISFILSKYVRSIPS